MPRSNLKRVQPGMQSYPSQDMNAIVEVAEKFQRLTVVGGSLSTGPSGTVLRIDAAEAEPVIAVATVASGSYPSFDNDRKVFPALIDVNPQFDSSLPNAAFTFSTQQVPHIFFYNLAQCWVFENTKLLLWKKNGQYWGWHNQKRTGVAAADITKGSAGSISVLGITISARALFGPTVNGQSVSVYHDGTEWVIDAEECP